MNFCLHKVILLVMFSAAARAFGTHSSRAFVVGRNVAARPQNLVARSMTASGEPDTSVVDTCQQKIQEALEADDVTVTGAYDDPNGSHISIEVVSSKFEGKRPVQRQQLVYKAIWEELQGPVHAVDNMICKTPDES